MDKMLSFLGLTRKSGNLLLGYNKNEEAVKFRKLRLIIISTDAADNTKDKFRGYGRTYAVPVIEEYTTFELGSALGHGEIAVIGVLDSNMAKRLVELHKSKNNDKEKYGGGPIVKNQST